MKNVEMSLQTKHRLAEALKKHMEKTDFSKIRVSELLKDCDITRSTFYYYFTDIYALLEWMFETEAIDLLKKADDVYTWDQGVLLLLQYVEQNSKVCLCAYNSLGRPTLERMFYQDVAGVMKKYVDSNLSDIPADPDEKAFIMDFYVRAFVSVLAAWMCQGMKKSPDEMLDLIGLTVRDGIRDALLRSANAR